jgi:hypothetical protein
VEGEDDKEVHPLFQMLKTNKKLLSMFV